VKKKQTTTKSEVIELSSATDGNIKRAWAKAGERIRYRQKLAAHRYNQDHRFVIYLTGDLVMLKSTKSHKFGTKYTGPYIVLRRLKGRTLVYKIQEIKYPYKRIIVNARRLKLYYHPEIRFYEELEDENGLINPTRRCSSLDVKKLLGKMYTSPKTNTHIIGGHQSGPVEEQVPSSLANINAQNDDTDNNNNVDDNLYERFREPERIEENITDDEREKSSPEMYLPSFNDIKELDIGANEVINGDRLRNAEET